MPESEVRPHGLDIRANDQTKPFGQELLLGPGQTAFAASGLADGETIGSVTLTAGGGAGADDAAGTYVITPSAATGATFAVLNCKITYLPGVLTVAGRSFAEWGAKSRWGASRSPSQSEMVIAGGGAESLAQAGEMVVHNRPAYQNRILWITSLT